MNNFEINNDLVVFKFNNIEIPFDLSNGPENIMVNVTEMVKAYGKRINDWLSLPSTQSYLQKVVLNTGKSGINDIVVTVKGRYGGGTWVNQLVLIELARWLDSEFAIWCNKIIFEVIKQRYQIELNQKDNTINNQNLLISQLQQDNQNLQSQISYFKPQLDYYNQVLQNPEPLYSTNQIIKQLGIKISNRDLIQKMLDAGLIFKDRNNNVYVEAKFNSMRYRVATTFKDKAGNIRSVNKWTEAGKQWIYSLAMGWKLL